VTARNHDTRPSAKSSRPGSDRTTSRSSPDRHSIRASSGWTDLAAQATAFSLR
jgi:hypothetical protein